MPMRAMSTLIGLGLALAACGDEGPAPPVAGTDVTVTALAGEHVYFGGEPNRRTVDVPVTFPAAGLRYTAVSLRVGLRCPSPGGCDWWDRLGRISLLQPPAPGETDPRELELGRFVTPYRVGGQLAVIDVTELQRVLEGPQTVRVFIDTWVGPGHANGAGWLVDASFDFIGGLPSPDPATVVPLWAPHRVVYGDPARPVDVQAELEVPDGTVQARVRMLVTGHGQGNADNCAEFCRRDHTITVGATPTTIELWRDDCPTTAVPNQQGTWRYARAGWCPGASVAPWIVDAVLPTGASTTVRYDVEPYTNTCRPDAAPCAGCALGNGCPYDGGTHTEPGWEQSGVAILYR